VSAWHRAPRATVCAPTTTLNSGRPHPDEGVLSYEELAYRAWPILGQRAAERSVITYGDLARLLGTHHRQIGKVLSVIQDYCVDEKLPPLTILIVNKATGHPGEGFVAWDADDIPTGLAQVYDYTNWGALPNPFLYAAEGDSLDKLAKRIVADPKLAPTVSRVVQDRGVAQSLFRLVLLDTYNRRCAFCRLSFPAALEAAHIIPWAQASNAQRLDPANGLLLCSTHHKLFDSGILGVSSAMAIQFVNSDPDKAYSGIDRLMSSALDGQMMFLPRREDHRPSVAALECRASRPMR
jgi:putative restriction endonuclease